MIMADIGPGMPLAVEAEEMRVQFLELDRAVEVRVLDESEWFAV